MRWGQLLQDIPRLEGCSMGLATAKQQQGLYFVCLYFITCRVIVRVK